MTNWVQNNWFEIIGASLALIYLILEVRQKWMMWVVGMVSSSLYVYINYKVSLYALAGLNACYVIQSAYGLYRWKLSESAQSNPMKISRITFRKACFLSGAGIFLFVLLAWVLSRYTNSPAPYSDALVASFSIIATWMTAHKIIEHWLIWIFINYFTVGLYMYTGLYPTAILFFIYGSMAIVGWFSWKKAMRNEESKMAIGQLKIKNE